MQPSMKLSNDDGLSQMRRRECKRMASRSCALAILTFAVAACAIGLECARAEECDYTKCSALMARDGAASWAVSGPHDYSPETKRACAELNACVRRAKNKPAGRAAAPTAVGPTSSKSSLKDSPAISNPEQAKGVQPLSGNVVHENSGASAPNADHLNGTSKPCFGVAEILVPVDCSPSRPQYTR